MGRKVFISVLGTGFYQDCLYAGQNSQTKTNFIQVATLNEIGAKNWACEDAVYILVTEKARKVNWHIENGTRLNNKNELVTYLGLDKCIQDLSLRCKVEAVDIKDGMTQNEMWDIFNQVYQLLEAGDELYFDFTHGFRYLPMFVLVFGNYAKYLKRTTIAHMSYGNFEMQGATKQIMDLRPLASLQDWTSSAVSFCEMGRIQSLTNTMKEDAKTNKTLYALNSSLKKFETQIETCRGKKIIEGKEAETIKSSVRTLIEAKTLPEPISQILLSIREAIQPFEANSMNNIIAALKWCKQFRLVQQGYTLCQEGLITMVCERFANLNPYDSIKKYREFWGALFGIDGKVASDETQWKSTLVENRRLARVILSLQWVKDIRVVYWNMTQRRNQVNHGGFTGNMSEDSIINDFDKTVDKIIEVMTMDMPAPEFAENEEGEKFRIFLNITNHPVSGWSDKQLSEALKYGSIEELPFPQVSPEANEAEIELLAGKCISLITEKINGKKATVHIMGEMTLTYTIVKRLQAMGVKCIASTTERCVKVLDNGIKESTFNFIGFREYVN